MYVRTNYRQIRHFPLMCAADKVWITELTLIHKNIRSVRNSHVQELTLILKIIGQCDDVTDKNNNASLKDLDIHYHSSSCRTCCDTSNNVCLDLQNCRYSIFTHFNKWHVLYITKWDIHEIQRITKNKTVLIQVV